LPGGHEVSTPHPDTPSPTPRARATCPYARTGRHCPTPPGRCGNRPLRSPPQARPHCILAFQRSTVSTESPPLPDCCPRFGHYLLPVVLTYTLIVCGRP
jgi:hypothetical protein